jgi:hypothetical protein
MNNLSVLGSRSSSIHPEAEEEVTKSDDKERYATRVASRYAEYAQCQHFLPRILTVVWHNQVFFVMEETAASLRNDFAELPMKGACMTSGENVRVVASECLLSCLKTISQVGLPKDC